MNLKELVEEIDLKPLNIFDLNKDVTNGLCTDLLSLVIGSSDKHSIWVTHQGHVNVVAVSLLAEISAVIVVGEVEDVTIKAAKEKGLNLFTTDDTAFDIVGKLYSLEIMGKNAKL